MQWFTQPNTRSTTATFRDGLFAGLAIAALAFLLAESAHAATPGEIAAAYISEATQQNANFKADAQRGAAFFAQRFAVNEKMPACVACHTNNPKNAGQHAITGKNIRPLAPIAEAARLTDPAKVEKWFGRNCKEVVGRACSAAEKADVVTWLMAVR